MRRIVWLAVFVVLGPTAAARGQPVTCWGIEGYVGDPKYVFTFPSDDPTSVTVIGPTLTSGVTFEGLEFHPDGTLYAYGRHADPAQTGLYTVDTATGAVTYIGGGSTNGEWVRGLAYDPTTGQLYAVTGDGASTTTWLIDRTTGAPSLSETTPALDLGDGIAFDAAGTLFLLDADETRVFRDCAAADLAPLGPTGLNLHFEYGITIDWSRDGTMYLVSWQESPSNRSELYTVDPANGSATIIGTIGTSSLDDFYPTEIAILPAAGPGVPIPAADCDADGLPDHCQIASGAVADLDLDGIPDPCNIAAGAPDCDGNGVLDIGDRFESSRYETIASTFIAAGEIDGAGGPDLVLGNSFGNSIEILLNDGTGHFLPGIPIPHPLPRGVHIEDFDGDGFGDLLIADASDIELRLNDGLGGFAPPVAVADHTGKLIATDLDEDGLTDLVVVDAVDEVIHIAIATAPAVFATTTWPLPGSSLRSSMVEDFDMDGDLDLLIVVSNTGPYLYEGNGTGALSPPVDLGSSVRRECESMDVDGDGTIDLVESFSLLSEEFRVHRGQGDGDFSLAATVPTAGSAPWVAVPWDLADNGLVAVALTEEESRFVALHRWETGTLVPFQVLPLHKNFGRINFSPETEEVIAVEDFDGDGREDMAVMFLGRWSVSVHLQRGEDCDRNGVLDLCDLAAGGDADGNGVLDACEPLHFLRGDTNDDGGVDIGDAIDLLARLFSGAGPAPCAAAADSNLDGGTDIGDVITVLGRLFAGDPPLPPPFPACGPSYLPSDLAAGCAEPGC